MSWKHCYRKSSFPTRQSARKEAKRLSRISRVKVDTYRCDLCGCVHVGRRIPDGDVGWSATVIRLDQHVFAEAYNTRTPP